MPQTEPFHASQATIAQSESHHGVMLWRESALDADWPVVPANHMTTDSKSGYYRSRYNNAIWQDLILKSNEALVIRHKILGINTARLGHQSNSAFI
jgi:hypothetical protein